mmetsp:Transcript_15292/g.32364  ORF Transcript_15292/g.32364 Transcript_15292/m.32364 type:complete len:83 (+) Transcript_15292:160-408(+)
MKFSLSLSLSFSRIFYLTLIILSETYSPSQPQPIVVLSQSNLTNDSIYPFSSSSQQQQQNRKQKKTLQKKTFTNHKSRIPPK